MLITTIVMLITTVVLCRGPQCQSTPTMMLKGRIKYSERNHDHGECDNDRGANEGWDMKGVTTKEIVTTTMVKRCWEKWQNTTIVVVATYPSAGGRRVTRGCVFQERNTRGVATNIYLRKTLKKPEKTWSTNFKWKVRELYLRKGKVLAPHASITRDDNL